MATPETPRSAAESNAWKWLVGVGLPLLGIAAGLAGGWLDANIQGDPGFVVDIVVRNGYYLVLGAIDRGLGQALEPGMQLVAVDAAEPRVLATVAPFPVEGARHVYRIEAAGNQIRVWVDGLLRMDVTDATFGRGGTVGLWCRDAMMTVYSFKVVRL